MQRSQRKRCAPSWLKRKPYIKIRFTQDGVTDKVTESWKIKLEENGKALDGALSNFSFQVGQLVWCYWKTANEKEREYFEARVIEVWDDSVVVENLQSRREADEESDDELVEHIGGKTNFTQQVSLIVSRLNMPSPTCN